MSSKPFFSPVGPAQRAATALFLALFAGPAFADGWAIMSEHEQLKNSVIVGVGEVSRVAPPINTKWQTDVYQINGRCLTFTDYRDDRGYGGKAALLLVSAQKTLQLALIRTEINSVKVELYPVSILKCPDATNVLPYSDDPEEHLRLLKKKLEELKKQQ